MFDIGFSELFVIAVVALLVLGPERLPKAARFAGLWVRRARAQWYSVKADLENELADDELKRSLLQARDQLQGEMRDLRDGLQHGAQAVQDGFALPGSAAKPPPAAADERAPQVSGSAQAAVVDVGPVDAAPVERMPVESVPIESRPIESMPVDNMPAERMPIAGVPRDTRPGDGASDDRAPLASPGSTHPAGRTPPPDGATGEADDDQR